MKSFLSCLVGLSNEVEDNYGFTFFLKPNEVYDVFKLPSFSRRLQPSVVPSSSSTFRRAFVVFSLPSRLRRLQPFAVPSSSSTAGLELKSETEGEIF
ncbi:hypothetical protein LWI29_025197 [Acer saccharum]|uniref:Uncharacterized protein n=1 Tax=Acer saccharum TaxID=4024 RepID=A0AA39TGQ6_ACESA|nr:hypothetical protein LWI29_025197 [Acer saccharum]